MARGKRISGLAEPKAKTTLTEVSKVPPKDIADFLDVVEDKNIAELATFGKTFQNESEESSTYGVNPFLIVTVFGSTEMIACMLKWPDVNWNEMIAVPHKVLGGILDSIPSRKVTVLYTATFMKRPEMVKLLLKKARLDNITTCLSTLKVGDKMEKLFLAEVQERLKRKLSKLHVNPVLIREKQSKLHVDPELTPEEQSNLHVDPVLTPEEQSNLHVDPELIPEEQSNLHVYPVLTPEEQSKLPPIVIPGYRVEKDDKPTRVLVVYSTDVTHPYEYSMNGAITVLLRNPYMVNNVARGSSEKQHDPMTTVPQSDVERAQKAIRMYSDKLWKNHSNLNIICVSPVKYHNGGTSVSDTVCVMLYCTTKGVVPLGEPVFPPQLILEDGGSVDVDVREGYFEFGGYETRSSTHRHDFLKMGCSIGRMTPQIDESGNPIPNLGGTLGPFVSFNGNMGFLTCAHVVTKIPSPESTYTFEYTYNGSKPVDISQPASDATTPSGSACGFVQRAVFNQVYDPSVDVAFVQISDDARKPTAGRFANDFSYRYHAAGFDELPEYNDASVQEDLSNVGATHMVVKFGSSTHLTKGCLNVHGTHVRLLSTVLGLPGGGPVHMKNQYSVMGVHPSLVFFDNGDSGAAVFMMEPSRSGRLHCIGMAIGRAVVDTHPYPGGVVTPISAVLQALGPDYCLTRFP